MKEFTVRPATEEEIEQARWVSHAKESKEQTRIYNDAYSELVKILGSGLGTGAIEVPSDRNFSELRSLLAALRKRANKNGIDIQSFKIRKGEGASTILIRRIG